MTSLLLEYAPALGGIALAIIGALGFYVRGKSTGKQEKQAEVTAKTNQQAAEAAKVTRDVDSTIDRMPDGAAAGELKRSWVRKPPAGRP